MKKCLNCGKEYSGKRYGSWLEEFGEYDFCTLVCYSDWKEKNRKLARKIDRNLIKWMKSRQFPEKILRLHKRTLNLDT